MLRVVCVLLFPLTLLPSAFLCVPGERVMKRENRHVKEKRERLREKAEPDDRWMIEETFDGI